MSDKTTIRDYPEVRQTETHYYLARCPACEFGHVSKINLDGCLIRCECGSPFRVSGTERANGR